MLTFITLARPACPSGSSPLWQGPGGGRRPAPQAPNPSPLKAQLWGVQLECGGGPQGGPRALQQGGCALSPPSRSAWTGPVPAHSVIRPLSPGQNVPRCVLCYRNKPPPHLPWVGVSIGSRRPWVWGLPQCTGPHSLGIVWWPLLGDLIQCPGPGYCPEPTLSPPCRFSCSPCTPCPLRAPHYPCLRPDSHSPPVTRQEIHPAL